MPLTVPRFLQARDLKTALVSGGTLGSSGITWGTGIEMSVRGSGTATWKAFEFSSQPSLTNFMSSDLGVANYQNEFEDFDFTAREITPVNGLGTLGVLCGGTGTTAGYDYLRFEYTYRARELSSGNIYKLVIVGIRGPYRNGFTMGENTQEVTIKPISYGVWLGLSTDTSPY